MNSELFPDQLNKDELLDWLRNARIKCGSIYDLWALCEKASDFIAAQDSAQPVGYVEKKELEKLLSVTKCAWSISLYNIGGNGSVPLYIAPASAPVKECVWTKIDGTNGMYNTSCQTDPDDYEFSHGSFCCRCGGKIKWENSDD